MFKETFLEQFSPCIEFPENKLQSCSIPGIIFFFFACLSLYLLQFSNQCSTSSSYGSVLLFLISIHFRTFFAISSTFYFILLCFFCLTVLTNSLLPLWVSSDCTYLYIFYTHTVSCRPTKRFLIFYS